MIGPRSSPPGQQQRRALTQSNGADEKGWLRVRPPGELIHDKLFGQKGSKMISLRRPLLPSSPPLLPLLVLLFLLGIAAGRGAESRGPLSLLPRPTTAAKHGRRDWVGCSARGAFNSHFVARFSGHEHTCSL